MPGHPSRAVGSAELTRHLKPDLETQHSNAEPHRQRWRTGVGGWDGAGWVPGRGCSFPAAQLHLGAAACSGAAGAQHLQGKIRGNWLLLAGRCCGRRSPRLCLSSPARERWGEKDFVIWCAAVLAPAGVEPGKHKKDSAFLAGRGDCSWQWHWTRCS